MGASDVKEAVVVSRNGDSGVYNASVLEVVEGVGGVVKLSAVADTSNGLKVAALLWCVEV